MPFFRFESIEEVGMFQATDPFSTPGLVQYQERRFAEALASLHDEADRESDGDRRGVLRLAEANCLVQLGRLEEATDLFFRVWMSRHELRSRDPLRIQFNLALCARRMGNAEQAVRHLELLIRECPPGNHGLLGLAWRELAAVWRPRDAQRALECSRRSLEVLPAREGGSAQQVEELSVAFSTSDDAAFERLLREMDLGPLSPVQRRRVEAYRIQLLARSGRHEELAALYRREGPGWPDDEHAVDLLAEVARSLRELGSQEEARECARRAWECYGRHGRIQDRDLLPLVEELARGPEAGRLPFEQMLEFGILGVSPPMLRLKNQLRSIHAGTLPVLITGETGTGKELAARSFVEPGRPFVAVNCRAVPAALMSSLLFGHVKGAFTGASQEARGWVQEAEGGVLFLDEVGDLPLEVQPLLFRFLDDGSYYRVGEHVERKARVRVVAATNLDPHDPEQMRPELTNRLAGFLVELPPLRERGDDLHYLAAWFVEAFNRESRNTRTLGPAAEAALRGWHYPGNVRELRFLVQRACTVSGGDIILPALEEELRQARRRQGAMDPPAPATPGPTPREAERRVAGLERELAPGFNLVAERRSFEQALRRKALEACGGNIRAAARLLGESPTGIQRMLNKDKETRP